MYYIVGKTLATTGLMIMASHQTFSGQTKRLSSQIKFDQIYYTLLMDKSLSLLKIINVRTIFSPYHKHCTNSHVLQYLYTTVHIIGYVHSDYIAVCLHSKYGRKASHT